MIRTFRILGAALAASAIALSVQAQAGDWRVTPLAQDGWSAEEKGEADEPTRSVRLVYQGEDFKFSFGCVLGYGIDVSWMPDRALEGGLLIPVKFSIDGDLLFERDIANNDRKDYAWQERGDATNAASLVYAIWEKGAGTLTIEGGGVTSIVPFDEVKNEYWSEEILFACGLF